MAEFVFNRTQAHVDRLKFLRAKGYENLSAAEREEYHGSASLGAYNYTDINRVEAAVAEISQWFGLDLTTATDRTNWTMPVQYSTPGANDIPMWKYLENVVAIRDNALKWNDTLVFPPLPETMDNLTWEMANNIEETLYIAYMDGPGRNQEVNIDDSSNN